MVDFITFGVLLGAEGYHRGSFWGSFGTLGPPFGGLWVALGVHFGESGGTPGRFQRAVASKRGGLNSDRSIVTNFGAQRVSRRLPKWS